MAEYRSLSSLQRLVRLFDDALHALGVSPSARQLEEWSVLVHASMSGTARNYHDVQHVFDVAEGGGAVETLAALFHDAVYVQADGTSSPHHEALLDGLIDQRSGGFQLRPYNVTDDRRRALVEAVFGVAAHTRLSPSTGLNEFLSAMLAIRALSTVLPDTLLMEIAAGIEATIPFREPDPSGRTPPALLFERLEGANRTFSIGLEGPALEMAVHRAVALANRDLAGFAFRDVGRFLSYTWKLLPESNAALREKSTYTIGEYHIGLEKMADFFRGLKPEAVFTQFRRTPDDATFSALTSQAASNIRRSYRYLQAKLLAISVLEALALLTGGDAPVALFMGDLPDSNSRPNRLEDHLPPIGNLHWDADAVVFSLLRDGRRSDSGFDIDNSPLAALIYAGLGDIGVSQLTATLPCPMDARSAELLLGALPAALGDEVIKACCKVALTRSPGLEQLLHGA